MATVQFSELLNAFQMASFGGEEDVEVYVCVETGAIYCVSESLELDEDVPDDIETSERYIPLPSKSDLDLGKSLALSFVDQELPLDQNAAAEFFRRKGAYGRFKDLLESRGCLEKWYAFEAAATEKALRQWCAENNLQLSSE